MTRSMFLLVLIVPDMCRTSSSKRPEPCVSADETCRANRVSVAVCLALHMQENSFFPQRGSSILNAIYQTLTVHHVRCGRSSFAPCSDLRLFHQGGRMAPMGGTEPRIFARLGGPSSCFPDVLTGTFLAHSDVKFEVSEPIFEVVEAEHLRFPISTF